MTVLEKIAATRLGRVEEARERVPLELLWERCGLQGPARDVAARLAAWPKARRAVIAEVKRRSPSKGPLAPDLDAAALGRAYEAGGAFAVSVLVEADWFGGGLPDLDAVRRSVDLPVLYKDFVVDPYQVWEARAHGADLVLLIAALLGERTAEYVRLAREVGVEPLVEVHAASEVPLALEAGAKLVGVNNRNLKTLAVDLAVGRELLARLPEDVFGVAESGLRTVEDLDALAACGARAFLIGESLVTAGDPAAALRRLVERGG